MNIFVLDKDPVFAAQYHCDKHVVKMCLETAQILCTVCHEYGVDAKYMATHKHHPCVIWAGTTIGNYKWLCQLGLALCGEYTHRYGKIHKSEAVIRHCFEDKVSQKLCVNGLMACTNMTPFAQAMPEKYFCDDGIRAYRNYYRYHKVWTIKCTWTNRDQPDWI